MSNPEPTAIEISFAMKRLNDTKKAKIKDLEDTLAALELEETALQDRVRDLESSIAKTEDLRKAEKQTRAIDREGAVSVLKDNIEALQRAHDLLKKENDDLEAKNEELDTRKNLLSEQVERLMVEVENCSVNLMTEEKRAARQRTEKQLREDSEFRARYDLPEDQYLIDRYTCYYNNVSGALEVAPAFVCFMLKDKVLKLAITGITAVEKLEGGRLSKSIRITMRGAQTFEFTGFSHRYTALRTMCNLGWAHNMPWSNIADLVYDR
eukprot:c11730_g1_i1.p1 GENE.c11730_g1_i1~~c11730_g1_i1.p1  ORF type:complete len:266 (+),score=70.93 c11730_g1_i1:57-854(+)